MLDQALARAAEQATERKLAGDTADAFGRRRAEPRRRRPHRQRHPPALSGRPGRRAAAGQAWASAVSSASSAATAASSMRAVQPAISTGGTASSTMRPAMARNASAAGPVAERDGLAGVAAGRHRRLERDLTRAAGRRRRAASVSPPPSPNRA